MDLHLPQAKNDHSYPEIINIWCSRNSNLSSNIVEQFSVTSDPVLLRRSIACHSCSIEIDRSCGLNVYNMNFTLKERKWSEVSVWPLRISGYVYVSFLPFVNPRDIVGVDECLWSTDISVVGTSDK